MAENSEKEISSILLRGIAFFIDEVFLNVIILSFYFNDILGIQNKDELISFAISFLPKFLIFFILYHTVFVYFYGGSLGKFFCGIRVVNDEFKGLSLRVSLLRTIMRYIGFYFMFIGLIIAVLNSQNKALHDIIADTIVIKAK